MKCYKHNEIDAVSTCTCGRTLCTECSAKFKRATCDYCALESLKDMKTKSIKNMIIMSVLFIGGFIYALGNFGFFESVLFAYLIAGIPFGWSAQGRTTSEMDAAMHVKGDTFIHYAFKLVFAVFIGMVITPIKIYQFIRDSKNIQELTEYTLNN